jgi:hypothetical protein
MLVAGIVASRSAVPPSGPITGTLTLNNSAPEWGLGAGGVGPVNPTTIEGINIDQFYYSNDTQEHRLHLQLAGNVKIPSLASTNLIAVTVAGSPINPIIMGWDGGQYLSSFDATLDAFFTVDDAVRSWSIEEAVPFYTGTMTVGFNGSQYGFSDGATFGAMGLLSPVSVNGVDASAIYNQGGPQSVNMIMAGFAQIPTIADGTIWMELDSELPTWLEFQSPLYVALEGTVGGYILAQNGNTVAMSLYGAV